MVLYRVVRLCRLMMALLFKRKARSRTFHVATAEFEYAEYRNLELADDGILNSDLGTQEISEMAAYPTANVHRPSRRSLGKNQYPTSLGVIPVVTSAASVATITFSRPVVVTGIIPMTVAGGPTFVSQAIVSPTVVTQTFSAALATHTYNLPAGAAHVASYQGGQTVGAAGTF